jgi:hypothetical protein
MTIFQNRITGLEALCPSRREALRRTMVNDEPLDPVDVSLFGADGVVLAPDDVAHLIEQFRFARLRHLHYTVRHGSDFVGSIPKLKPD